MKKFITTAAAFGLLFALTATSAKAQFVNRNAIFGSGNTVMNLNQGFGGFGSAFNDNLIVGNGNQVINSNSFGLPFAPVGGGVPLGGAPLGGPALGGVPMGGGFGVPQVMPGSIFNSNQIFGNFNSIANINGR